jgi:hypothetical protein
MRLDGEAIHDAMLAVSGELSERLYGPYIETERDKDGGVIVPENAVGSRRRAIYLQQRRTQVDTLLELFDAPVMVNNCAVRGTSTVPLQSLELLNSNFVRSRAAAFSAATGAGADLAGRVRRAIAVAFGRSPTAFEEQASVRFVQQQIGTYHGAKNAPQRAWNDFCQMLLASNAFLYVE